MYIKPVIIRTIDIGGNKFFEILIKKFLFLEIRKIRFTLNNQEIFKTQIKEILRKSIMIK